MVPALVLATASFTAVCFAQPAFGPSLAPGQTLRGRFVQTRILKGIAAPLKSEGTFVLVPGKGLIWRVEQPIQTTTVIDPGGVRQIINGNEVQRVDAARVPFIAHFYHMLDGALMGNWTAMQHDFAVATTGDRTAWRTVLTPKRPDDPIAGILSSIAISGGKLAEDVQINRSNGDSEHIVFLDQSIFTAGLSAEETRLLSGGNLDSPH
jgi:hypothetical protein